MFLVTCLCLLASPAFSAAFYSTSYALSRGMLSCKQTLYGARAPRSRTNARQRRTGSSSTPCPHSCSYALRNKHTFDRQSLRQPASCDHAHPFCRPFAVESAAAKRRFPTCSALATMEDHMGDTTCYGSTGVGHLADGGLFRQCSRRRGAPRLQRDKLAFMYLSRSLRVVLCSSLPALTCAELIRRTRPPREWRLEERPMISQCVSLRRPSPAAALLAREGPCRSFLDGLRWSGSEGAKPITLITRPRWADFLVTPAISSHRLCAVIKFVCARAVDGTFRHRCCGAGPCRRNQARMSDRPPSRGSRKVAIADYG